MAGQGGTGVDEELRGAGAEGDHREANNQRSDAELSCQGHGPGDEPFTAKIKERETNNEKQDFYSHSPLAISSLALKVNPLPTGKNKYMPLTENKPRVWYAKLKFG